MMSGAKHRICWSHRDGDLVEFTGQVPRVGERVYFKNPDAGPSWVWADVVYVEWSFDEGEARAKVCVKNITGEEL